MEKKIKFTFEDFSSREAWEKFQEMLKGIITGIDISPSDDYVVFVEKDNK